MSDECRHYNDDTNECAETGGQCDVLPLQTEDCIVYLRAALAELRTLAEGLAQRLRDPFYEGLDEGYVSCDMCSSEEGRPGPRRSCEGCNETGGCGDYELMHSYDAWKEKNP